MKDLNLKALSNIIGMIDSLKKKSMGKRMGMENEDSEDEKESSITIEIEGDMGDIEKRLKKIKGGK